jgi:hypothetical protein
MNAFDKICGVLAFPLGVVLLILGVVGLFVGCSAHFSLPPILGVVPAFVGLGIMRSIYIAWNCPRRNETPIDMPMRGPLVDRPPSDNPYDAPRF